MSNQPDTSAIIVAAGSASRMGRNKQLLEIDGVPVIARTLSAFQRCKDIAEIVVVAREQDQEEFIRLAQKYGVSKLKAVVKGGADRKESVACGLQAVSPDLPCLAIHDGARPFILPALISQCIEDARNFGASALAVKVKDTIKIVQDGFISSTPDRETLWQCQTPQVFSQSQYRSACEAAKDFAVTDDCMLMEHAGYRVHITPGDFRNLKITSPEDLAVAQAVAQEEDFRMEDPDENRTRI